MQLINAKRKGDKIQIDEADAHLIIALIKDLKESAAILKGGTPAENAAAMDAGISRVYYSADDIVHELTAAAQAEPERPLFYKQAPLVAAWAFGLVGAFSFLLFTPVLLIYLFVGGLFAYLYFKEREKSAIYKQRSDVALLRHSRAVERENMQRAANGSMRAKVQRLEAEMEAARDEAADLALVAMSAAPMAWDADTEAEAAPDYETTQTPGAAWMGGIIGNPPIS